MEHKDDRLIVDLFINRSEDAITATSEKYGKLCKTISNRILKNEEDAEECVNDAYLTLWNTIPPENPNPFVAYLCKVVRNITLKKYRYNTAEKRNSYYDTSFEELEDYLVTDEMNDEVTASALTDAINNFLGTIKNVDRVIFVKKYWFCMEIPEIAEEMGLSANYINVHLYRTKKKLKQYLVKENYYEEENVRRFIC